MEGLRALLVVLVVAIVVTAGAPSPELRAQRPTAGPPEVTGYEIDNDRCFEPFMGADAARAMPMGGQMTSGGNENRSLGIDGSTQVARRTLETWLATGPTAGRRFIISPRLDARARPVGFVALCVVARAIVTSSDITFGAPRPASPASRWVTRSLSLSEAARARVNDSLAQRVAFFGAGDVYLGWWTVGALASGHPDAALEFLR